ncbi:sodium-dependent transporter [Anaeromyxobacter diazotrophicus]|uniref:Transporter n=1 Tax=Anaeromyxobacter diazotrophicus TaxID=2590199 RepID=A0A7I9VH51_9BACT|nr:sodium-dependent transporter [Anaeromyxobacter diazotrophicus]GEJ55723.1 sodium-dependent transporter [Anaeromyxobacter diazotrophicus]
MAPQPNDTRDTFASTLGAFTATVGSAIGLGNIWKFPYLTGSNGGAAFVLTYLLAVALVGVPVMVVEHVIGRRMRLDAVRAYRKVVPHQPYWQVIGWAGLASAVLIMAFYTDVAGWVFAYVWKSAAAAVAGRTLAPQEFGALASGTVEPIAWQLGVLVLTTGIIAAGVSQGIEKVTKALMPLLFALLLVCDVRALTLPGSTAGVAYLFRPDLSKLSGAVLLSALGLAFFKLSLGMGTMTTYGSYLPDRVRIVPNAARVALADTAISLLAGLAIFPAVFAFGGTPAGGPGLLFATIPLIFSKMPLGGLFTVVFFVLTAIATIGAMVSLIEVPVAFLVEKGHVRRPVAAALTGAAMFALGVTATLSQSPVLSGVKLFGKSFFDLYDFLSSNVLLPVGGLAIAVVGGWLVSRTEFMQELDKGYAGVPWHGRAVYAFVRYVAPGLILLILLSSLGAIGPG